MITPPPPQREIWVMAKGYAPDEGGMQSYARGVAEAYAATGARVTVFGQSTAGPRREQVGSVFLIDVGPGKSARVPLRLVAAMRRQSRTSGRPLFVHGTTWRTSLLPLLLGLPYVTTFHGREFMGGGAFVRQIMLRVAQRALAVVAVSRYTATRLISRLGPNCPQPLVLWNGTSVGEAPGSLTLSRDEALPVTILSLCRLERRKNIAACVRVCGKLRQEGHDFRYLVAGRGPELEAIRTLVEELQLQDNVAILGRVETAQLPTLYEGAGIFLHPQIAVDDDRDFEGFGITIADAMMHKVAVIAGRAGGPADIIDDGVTGLLVDGEDGDALVSTLRRVVTDPVLRTRLAEAGWRHASTHFRWDLHVAGILGEVCAALPSDR